MSRWPAPLVLLLWLCVAPAPALRAWEDAAAGVVVVQAGASWVKMGTASFAFSAGLATQPDVALIESLPGAQGAYFGRWNGIWVPLYEGYLLREGAVRVQGVPAALAEWTGDNSTGSAFFSYAVAGIAAGARLNVTLSNFAPDVAMFTLTLSAPGADEVALEPTMLTFPVVGLALAVQDAPAAPERFFGLGQRWSKPDLRGQTPYCWTEDGSWSFLNSSFRLPAGNATYMPMPWLLSSRGVALFVNTTYRTNWQIAAPAAPAAWSVETETATADHIFMLGQSPAALLALFTQRLRGASLIPPPWAMAPWKQLQSSLPSNANASDLEIANAMIAADVPYSLDQGYVHYFPTGDQRGQEAELAAQNAALAALGVRVTCYFNSFVDVDYQPVFSFLNASGFLLRHASGAPYTMEYAGDILTRRFHAGLVDFTNAGAVAWYQAQMASALNLSFSGWMYDYAEYAPLDCLASDGQRGDSLHNAYPYLYQKAAHDLLVTDAASPYAPDAVFFHRSGDWRSGAMAWAHWTGDAKADWSLESGLPAQVAGCLSSSLSGVAFCGSDIGGYVCELAPPTPPELLDRWLGFGAFAGIMRDETQGSDCYNSKGVNMRAQVFTSNATLLSWRKYAKLRTALFPYVYTSAHQVHYAGLPLMRHHVLTFPADPAAVAQSYQYTFGDCLLVAPVLAPGQRNQTVYLPAGALWTDFASVAAYESATDGRFRLGYAPTLPGGQTVTVQAPLSTTPMFVRAGCIVATIDPAVDTLNAASDPRVTPLSALAGVLHLWLFPNASGAAAAVWDGAAFALTAAPGGKGWAFAASDPLSRHLVLQLPLPAAPVGVAANASSVPMAAAWAAVAAASPPVAAPLAFWDAAQRVLWLALPPAWRAATILTQ